MTDRHNWKLGASTCILRGADNHTDEGFASYEKAGIKYAEFTVPVWNGSFEKLDFYDNPEKLFKTAKRHDVEFSTFHAPFSRDVSLSHPDENVRVEAIKLIKKTIASAIKIGIKTIVLHPSAGWSETYSDREAYIRQTIEHVRDINDYCQSLGGVIALENMTEDAMCGCSSEMIRFLEEIPTLAVCFDANHCTVARSEEYLADLFNAGMKGRIKAVHISDYDLDVEAHRLPGDGKNNWNKILSMLEKLEFDGVFMYEVSKPNDRENIYTPQDVKKNFSLLMNGKI